MNEIIWEKVGEITVGYKKTEHGLLIVGINGIVRGDKVLFKGKEFVVSTINTFGCFGLSETGENATVLAYAPSVTKTEE